MSSPTINFTDPNGLSAFFSVNVPVSSVSLVSLLPSLVLLPNVFCRWSLLCPGHSCPPLALGANPRIPLPPMGRQVVLTFPPIYKERPKGRTEGQIFPAGTN